ncbi:lipoate--protein ligase family protein [Lentilactobacillus senioris]|uniref:lipoate--protein ligase family protein n=1 Tax=Lentilactobacillus senioris TaxID=931534 RepID=UPI0006D06E3E|nr:hypothetical protein [Lentilactobacillus senioris]
MAVSSSTLVVDSVYSPANQLLSFADTNTLLNTASQTTQGGFLHFWTTSAPTVILGLNDKRLPNLTAGLTDLTAHGYQYFLRNSGGLAVVSDPPGVLNVSLIFHEEQALSVDTGYEIMTQLIQNSFPELTIKAFEISDSYCPGTYDLSVNGQKIAGIAQRRTKNAISLMLYLGGVNGDQLTRGGQTIRSFYDVADADYSDGQFPLVNPSVMTTLNDLNPALGSINVAKERILTELKRQQPVAPLAQGQEFINSPAYLADQQKALRQMQLRNQVLIKEEP